MNCDWCICGCGQQIFDNDSVYSSSECELNELRSSSLRNSINDSPPASTKKNYRFSVAISTSTSFSDNTDHHRDSYRHSNMISPSSSTTSSYTESVPSSSFGSISSLDRQNQFPLGHQREQSRNEYFYNNMFDQYNEYYSNSVPIKIPRSESRCVHNDEPLEINKGTFGEDKFQLP
ncbi:hypothetical protein G9A89_015252 [Geosiphon pyriformis]|nr:hypothetical protein G9A89_015252 [Geosiphon pyriformis]